MTSRILVTGATGGVGELLVRRLSARGDAVVAHARDRGALAKLVAELSGAPGEVTGIEADLSSLVEVARLASEVGTIDALVNNAGVGFGSDRSKRETSRDGFELRFAVNFLAAFLLTETLVAQDERHRLRAIVHVASIGQAPLDDADLMSAKPGAYEGVLAYRRSKLAMVMDTFERAARDKTRSYVAVHPGTFLATKMVRDAGITPQGKAEDGAIAVEHALDAALAGASGVYFDTVREARANDAAYDAAAQARLREAARNLTAPFAV
jgi:NAD(P)-dependent dehydrogenase (short-subunit alcohol dehydrogenase family)